MKRMPALAAASAVALVTLAGCGGSDKTTTPAASATSAAPSPSAMASDNTASTGTSTATSTSSATGDASGASSAATPTASQPPAGYHLVTSPAQKLAFAIPDGWIIPSGKLLQDPNIAKAVETVDMMAISPKPENGFASNVNVIKPADNDPRLATRDAFAAQLAKTGGTVTGFDKVHTSLGDGDEVTYSITANGRTHHVVSLVVPNGQGTYPAITVSTNSADEAARVATVILGTLKTA